MRKKIKVFGASLDPSDSIKKITIKQKYLDDLKYNRDSKHNIYLDSYDAFIAESKTLQNPIFQKIGKFPVESWLRTKPDISDLFLLNPIDFRTFLDTNGCKEYSEEMEKFINQKVLPDIPIMIGADHSLTGGVISALSKKYGAENITTIILDGHFDAIPTDLRLDLAKYSKDHQNEVEVIFPEMLDSINEFLDVPKSYNCGTFLQHLIEDGIILPENLIIYGCKDYPNDEFLNIEDPRIKNYVDYYFSFKDRGTKIIPNTSNSTKMNEQFESILNSINTPYLYISIDVDVGAANSILAARFLEFIGIDEDCFIQSALLLKNFIKRFKKSLVHWKFPMIFL